MRQFKHPDILHNKEKNAEQRKADDEYIRKVRSAVKRVFEGSEDGRFVFNYIMDYCDIWKMTMTGTSWTFFNEGKRDVGLHLLSLREMQWFDEVQERRNDYLKKIESQAKQE